MSHLRMSAAYLDRLNPQFELFRKTRLYIFIPVAVASIIVLSIAASFADLFLPRLHRPFIIYALIVPSCTLFMMFLMLVQNVHPEASDVVFLCVMACLWLTLGAWSEDKIGHIQCFTLSGRTIQSKSGTTSAQAYCEKMKVVEAFSWLAFVLVLALAYYAYKYVIEQDQNGRYYSGAQAPGGYYGYGAYPAVPQVPGQAPYVVQQQPGHSVVIQNTPGGQPVIQQVPEVGPSGRF